MEKLVYNHPLRTGADMFFAPHSFGPAGETIEQKAEHIINISVRFWLGFFCFQVLPLTEDMCYTGRKVCHPPV